jgi:hypothetical protein
MAAATVSILERNGASPGTPTASITNSNFGSTDAVNLDPVAYPITANTYSYEKWQQFNLTNLGTSSAIKNLQVWYTGTLSGSDTFKTNCRTSSYGGSVSYATPINTVSSYATQTMPSSNPGAANLGIAGSLTGSLTSTGTSDYMINQIHVDSATTAGTTLTMNYQYDEIA